MTTCFTTNDQTETDIIMEQSSHIVTMYFQGLGEWCTCRREAVINKGNIPVSAAKRFVPFQWKQKAHIISWKSMYILSICPWRMVCACARIYVYVCACACVRVTIEDLVNPNGSATHTSPVRLSSIRPSNQFHYSKSQELRQRQSSVRETEVYLRGLTEHSEALHHVHLEVLMHRPKAFKSGVSNKCCLWARIRSSTRSKGPHSKWVIFPFCQNCPLFIVLGIFYAPWLSCFHLGDY